MNETVSRATTSKKSDEAASYTIITHGSYRGIVRHDKHPQPWEIPECALNPDGSLNTRFSFLSHMKKEEDEEGEEEKMPDLVPLEREMNDS